MKQALFSGCGTALITPFHKGKVDYEALRLLIEQQIEGGVDALIVCGTTAEATTLRREERQEVIDFTIRAADHRLPVIVGTGSNSTAQAIELSTEAKSLGADGLLVVTPYYNKATQTGLIGHFTAIAAAVAPLPVILYNVPSRTGLSCTADTYAALSQIENIVGAKEASGNFALIQDTLRRCPEDFAVWSGNDEDTAAICMFGGAGVISVASNILPATISALTNLCKRGRFAEAGQLQLTLSPFLRSLFCEVNPIPIKTLLAHKGICGEEFRLPLCSMAEEKKKSLLAIWSDFEHLR